MGLRVGLWVGADVFVFGGSLGGALLLAVGKCVGDGVGLCVGLWVGVAVLIIIIIFGGPFFLRPRAADSKSTS